MSDWNLEDPEIGWIQRTGFPSWCQEILAEFDDDEPEESEDLLPMYKLILDNIGYGYTITRAELSELTGLSDRRVREIIEDLRREFVILNDQNGAGYYRTHNPIKILKYYRQELARALSILRRLKPMRILLKGAGLI